VAASPLQAFDAGGQVLVRWETQFEVGAVGFDLYRESQGQWVKVNRGMLPAQDSLAGGRYELLDAGAPAPGPHSYRLAVTLTSGRTLDLKTDSLLAVEPVDIAHVVTQRTQPRIPPTPPEETRLPLPIVPMALQTPVDLPASSAAVKITTTVQGLHFLSTATLAAVLGQTTETVQGWIDGGTIALSNQGRAANFVPGNGWISAGKLGPGIYFYAEPILNNYTARNVYWIRGGINRYSIIDGGNPSPAIPGPYTAQLEAESDQTPGLTIVEDPETDFWFWKKLTAGNPQFDTFTSSFSVERLVRTAGTTAAIRVRLYGGSATRHSVEVRLNGVLLGAHSWAGIAPQEAEFPVDATLDSILKDSAAGQGSNTLTVQALLQEGVSASAVWVDGYHLSYARTYSAASSRLEAEANNNSIVTVPNFGTGTAAPVILAFDITDVRQMNQIHNLRIDQLGPGSTWEASFAPDRPAMRFAMIQPVIKAAAQVLTATSLAVVYPAHLSDPGNRGSYVAIAPASLLASGQQLADYRSKEFRTKVVLLDDIFHEFSHGLATPHAIARFIQTACLQWAIPPRYVVLVGDGTWDYRDLTASRDNLLPPLMVHTPYGLFTSDSLLANISGDGVMRVMIGRLPVVSAAAFTAVFAKIQSYEAERIEGALKALLVADQPDGAGDFIADIEAIAGYLAPAFTSCLVHPNYEPAEVNAPVIRTEIQSLLNGGIDIFSYVGHGATTQFGATADYYLRVIQPQTLDPILANAARLPILVAMTCVAGQYSSPGYTSLAEGVLREPGAGAVAVVAPTGLSYDDEAVWLNRRIMELFACNTSSRLGDAFAQSASLYNSRNAWLTPVWIYNLLGDPALKLVTPSFTPALNPL